VIQKLNLTFLLLIVASQLIAQNQTQSLLGSTGFYQSVSGFSVSYTIGELAITSETSGNYLLTQGFQQPDTINGAVEEEDGPEFIKAFPNPVKDYLTILLYKSGVSEFWIDAYNLKGSKSMHLRIEGVYYGESKVLNLKEFPKGMYIFHIYSSDGKLYEKLKVVKI
jgi:hypothetical protein